MLSPEMVLYAYSEGIFPMAHAEAGNEIYWHEPVKRGILPLDRFHVSRNLKKLVDRKKFEVSFNRDFPEVIRQCAISREDTWISEEIREVYIQLHRMGWAHSVETWDGDGLAGGLYGVAIGKAFFGESMFHKVTDASKVAMVHLVDYLRNNRYELLDLQYLNAHTRQFGGIEVSKSTYRRLLQKALHGITFGGFFMSSRM